MNKYKLTSETKEWMGVTLHRIEYLKDFADIEKGDEGGWIEKEENLSQDGDARVYGNAWVYGNAQVYGDARVYGDAQVYGDARVYGNAWVYGNAQVYGDARVYGDAQVYGVLELIGGYFYHTKEKSEEIEKIELDEDYKILCSEPELGEDEEENDLHGTEVEVKVNGKTYKARIE